ncbi:DM13 domain-containing protein [Candidatus Ponderosibacter sp. Uisw_141_02]|uniref:DM13 domain-containing protein n=1 Tax=Candidatus Ponderosibacter sp. Uisw_141_02 TaxID=3231000 RepID=UPI003D4F1EA8
MCKGWACRYFRLDGTISPGPDYRLYLAPAIDLDEYDAVVIWCEAFKQFITAARLEN